MKFDKDIMQKVRRYQNKRCIYYIKPTDKSFIYLKRIYVFTFICNLILAILTVWSYMAFNNAILAENPTSQKVQTEYARVTNFNILVIVLWVIFIVGLILTLKEHFFKGLLTNVASITALMFTYYNLYVKEDDFTNPYPTGDVLEDYIFKYVVPLAICAIFVLAVGILGTRAYLKDKKAYIELTDKDYVPQFKE